MPQSLIGLRNKIIEKLGHGESADKALDVIAEHFDLPMTFETCTLCEGKGRVPFKAGTVPCPRCYMAGKIKVRTWQLP